MRFEQAIGQDHDDHQSSPTSGRSAARHSGQAMCDEMRTSHRAGSGQVVLAEVTDGYTWAGKLLPKGISLRLNTCCRALVGRRTGDTGGTPDEDCGLEAWL